MRKCIFCENRAGNAEHVIAECISKRMELRDLEIIPLSRDEKGIREQRNPIKFKSFTTKKVCAECNNGWMGDLEAKMVNTLGELISPDGMSDDETFRKLIHADYDHLARWLVKTAIIAECAAPKVIEKAVPESYLSIKDMALGAPLFVYAGKCFDPFFRARLTKFLMTQNGKGPELLRHQDSFVFGIQLNSLLLAAVNCPSALPGFVSPARIAGKTISPIISGHILNDGPQLHLFESFEHFLDSIEIWVQPNSK